MGIPHKPGSTPLAVFFFLAIFLLIPSPYVQAQGLSDPTKHLGKGHFSIAPEIQILSKIEFDDTTADAVRHISDGTVENYQYDVSNLRLEDDLWAGVTLGYGITSRITFFAKAGLVTDGKKSSGSDPDRYYKLHDAFAWGFGAKAILWESGTGGSLTFAAQYLRYDDRGQHRAWDSSWSTDFEIDLWQIDAALVGAWTFDLITPYAGIILSHGKLTLSGYAQGVVDDLTRKTYSDYNSNNENKLGAMAGVAWDISPGWRCVLQGNFITETSGLISLTVNF